MLIEDDPDDVFLFERALDKVKAGLRQEIALERVGDGLDAAYRVSIEDLTNRLPDVLVLDLNMPRLNGIKFLHALRATLELSRLPVVRPDDLDGPADARRSDAAPAPTRSSSSRTAPTPCRRSPPRSSSAAWRSRSPVCAQKPRLQREKRRGRDEFCRGPRSEFLNLA